MTSAATARAGDLPAGFYETEVFNGLDAPTAVAFAPDGDVYITEQSGLLLRFDGLDDTTPETVLDVTGETNWFGDRGLLGLALDPEYASNKTAYIVYTYDAPVGATAPYYNDSCVRHCEVTAQLERVDLSGSSPQRTVLIRDDWCGEYQSHSIGTLAFDSQGRLYVGGGDGADFNNPDYGQATPGGSILPWNECGDPPGPKDSALSAPTAEGGALRSQDYRTSADPLGLSGTIIRIDPENGNGVPGNPAYNPADPDSNESRLLAYGLRNPFRFTVAPNDKLWLGDAGWRATEEINLLPTDGSTIPNYGWPCYEGNGKQAEYDAFDLNLCENLYADNQDGTPAVTAPAFTYGHHAPLYPQDPCPVPGGGSATSGIAFYTGDSFPSEYAGSLFFTDYARYCIWRVPVNTSGDPVFSQIEVFDDGVAAPVDLKVGPDGALYYVDWYLGELRRIQHTAGNTPPVALAAANPEYGGVPLTVNFDATGSTDADAGDTLTYEWDLNGDGDYGDPEDSTAASPSHTYTSAGTVIVRLRVDDGSGEKDTDTIRIDVGNLPPTPTITAPAAGTTWTVGDELNFHGVAIDPDQGQLPPSAIRWDFELNHCVPGGGCHVHNLQTVNGDDDAQIFAPNHYYPAYLTVTMRATDNKGLARETSLDLQPNTVAVQAQSIPAGLVLDVNDQSGTSPQAVTAIKGSEVQLGAPSPQPLSGTPHRWCQWSDGGSRVHLLTANAPLTVTATYAPNCPPTDLDLASPTVAENQPAGTVVGGLSTTDPENDDAHAYSLASGTGDADNAKFEIAGTTLRTAAELDYETQSTYSVRIRTDDGHGGTTAKAFTVNVSDANDRPSAPTLSGSWVAENLPAGSLVGEIASSDQDAGDTAAFSLVNGPGDTDNADFRVVGSTLLTARPLDFEAGPKRELRLAVTDAAGAQSQASFSIAVADIAEPIELDVIKTKTPRSVAKLLDDGIRSLLRCSADCKVRIRLLASGRVARKIGLRSKVGEDRARLRGGSKEWVTVELNSRSQRLLAEYDGRRMPRIEPSFRVSRR